MNISKRIQQVSQKQYPEKQLNNDVWVQARVPKDLKTKAEAKMLQQKAGGDKINWQVLVIALLEEYIG